MKLSPQAATVRDHLYANAHLTSWQAEGVYRIRRLASRVSELRDAGYEIEKQEQTDATGQRYTRYGFTGRQRSRSKPVLSVRRATVRYSLNEVEAALRASLAELTGIATGLYADDEWTALKAQLENIR